MAIMLPEIPKEFSEISMEGLVFEKLSKLSDDYFIFHSYQITEIGNNKNRDIEVDFVLFHPKKGILAIEVKAGYLAYTNGAWRYRDGSIMRHDGPFNQAKNNKYKIVDYLKKKDDPYSLIRKCGFFHAVCFPEVQKGTLANMNLPAEAPKELIITYNDLDDIENCLNNIFKYHDSLSQSKHESLNSIETKYMINNILSPSFNLFPSNNILLNEKNRKFNKMLDEQKVLMDFLENQRYATINGAAGTGKTMLAVEKARRLAEMKEKVLFLCFNRDLRDYLQNAFPDENIHYFTLDAYTLKTTGVLDQSYKKLEEYLEKIYFDQLEFDYQHVIIDEGQDFGQEKIEEQQIIEILDLIVKNKNGCFYIFYDNNQLIQGSKIPKYITEADCRITLYKNCRNTTAIAHTSMKPIQKEPKLYEGALSGQQPILCFGKDKEDFFIQLNESIDKYLTIGYSDIVIISVKSMSKSLLNTDYSAGFYSYKNKNYKWTTSRKFKGLEADVIILIDVDRDTFIENSMLFYVGASRAKFELSIIALISKLEGKEIVEKLNPNMRRFSVEKGLAAILNAIPYGEII